MASLALIVTILILAMLFVGPAVWGLSFLSFIPDVVIAALSVACIAYGFWWLFLPVWPTAFMGVMPIFFGFWALDKRVKKRMEKKDEQDE